MSATTENTDGGFTLDVASEDDVRRTLQELQRKNSDLEKDLATERSRRVNVETNLDGERVARTTAEAERDTHAARVTTEAEARWNAEKAAATTAISAKEKALELAEDDYARHAELGEWKEAAKAQTKIATETAEIHALRQKAEWLETNKEKLVPKPVVRTEQPRAPAEPASNHRYAKLITGPLVGGEEAWLDARPKFQSDAAYREEVFSASAFAARRHERGSDSYFREIERILGEESEQPNNRRNDPPPPRNQPSNRQAQSADLPASRRSGPGENPAGSQGEIRLTPEEVDMADGLYGNPNSEKDWYIADPAKRYAHYHEMKQRKLSRG